MSSGEDSQDRNAQYADDEDAGKYDHNESFAEEALPKQNLNKEIISECISMPYRLGYGFSHAFVKLDCTDKRLDDINILRQYIHLRFVILSNNFITDICPVSVIGHLIYLKADNNQIESATCLNNLRFLQFLDLSGNKLRTINDLSFPYMQHLKVNENIIDSLNGEGYGLQPSQLPVIQTLEVRSNKLKSLQGIGGIATLKSLYCAENSIRSTDGIANLTSLVRLHMRDNRLSKLVGFNSSISSLEYINMRGNRISRFRTIKELAVLPSLKVLSLIDNPITEKDDYRLMVIGYLRNLQRLDKERVSESERSEGAALVANRGHMEEEASEPEDMEEHHNAEALNEEGSPLDAKADEPSPDEDDQQGEDENEEENDDEED